ncbi:three-helix bundle dimerization domain-containing protein [Actinomadura opuntiae]|uniref:three-helix bundle dimerization domain-containing protein n=1 Tax=Actinomadura sp. OS1-43 TaxID=604315 RepID=UPI00255A83CF|nr:hypothetical protein [Actinomadura sp. OS1-43]MDL4812934.1 hypothetical protein [Actinomadura sp. OS1-43]
MDTEVFERTAMEQVTTRLLQTYGDDHSPQEITRTVEAVHRDFDGRPIRDFVPILVERHARAHLSG